MHGVLESHGIDYAPPPLSQPGYSTRHDDQAGFNEMPTPQPAQPTGTQLVTKLKSTDLSDSPRKVAWSTYTPDQISMKNDQEWTSAKASFAEKMRRYEDEDDENESHDVPFTNKSMPMSIPDGVMDYASLRNELDNQLRQLNDRKASVSIFFLIFRVYDSNWIKIRQC
jgi:hypothetical protein